MEAAQNGRSGALAWIPALPHHAEAECPWSFHTTSLSLRFLICQLKQFLTSQGLGGNKGQRACAIAKHNVWLVGVHVAIRYDGRYLNLIARGGDETLDVTEAAADSANSKL